MLFKFRVRLEKPRFMAGVLVGVKVVASEWVQNQKTDYLAKRWGAILRYLSDYHSNEKNPDARMR